MMTAFCMERRHSLSKKVADHLQQNDMGTYWQVETARTAVSLYQIAAN